MNIIHDLLTTYWSQITLLLLGIGYLIKRILDLVSKKREINHNLFQEKKLNSVNTLFQVYAEVEQMWTEIAIYDILDKKLSGKEIDEIIYPSLNRLKRVVLELQIYFEDEKHKFFNDILENTFDINRKLFQVYFDVNSNYSITQRADDFFMYKKNKLESNNLIFKIISNIMKDTFK